MIVVRPSARNTQPCRHGKPCLSPCLHDLASKPDSALERHVIEDALQRVLRPWSAPKKTPDAVSLPHGGPNSSAAGILEQILRMRSRSYSWREKWTTIQKC